MNVYEKMHQALLALDAWAKVVKNNPKDKTAIECAEFVEETIKAALAEPPRNCDVGTAEEQYERYRSQCRAQDCCDCPVRMKWDFGQTGRESCQLVWAQMHYEEGGVK